MSTMKMVLFLQWWSSASKCSQSFIRKNPKVGPLVLPQLTVYRNSPVLVSAAMRFTPLWTQGSGHLVLPALLQPATLAFVGGVYHTLVDVHDTDSPV